MIFIYFLAYIFGHILSAHIVGRIFYNRNIFTEGSGNPGARNAGRSFGKKGFMIVLFGDMLKVIVICLLAEYFKMNFLQQTILLLLVILGHMYPILYKFKGGKGVASFIGGILYISPLAALCLGLTFLITYPFVKSFTKAGLAGIALTPIFTFFFHHNIAGSLVIFLIILLIVMKHKEKRVIVGDGI
ncbi:glycerol-3-phosphate acyltransferase [Bacillus sp. FJAT-49736]|uniref:glycerol-3-phosphate acyltransferase n=1 Tax=Bacillus sp. FJAT-49736 TaxID=2833582 RepID=UPI001BC8D698|nr:glycerol-3-phosphate acyltransferase [Bacillus sp. FJAT-49736]MBS4172573.1 glycerol-3-phosphate acyltransferase [Bacillus sp. FJAT-49736]